MKAAKYEESAYVGGLAEERRLLPAICRALGIDAHDHHSAINTQKVMIKTQMREIKEAIDKARGSGDHAKLHELRRAHHHLNHALRTSAKRAMLQH